MAETPADGGKGREEVFTVPLTKNREFLDIEVLGFLRLRYFIHGEVNFLIQEYSDPNTRSKNISETNSKGRFGGCHFI